MKTALGDGSLTQSIGTYSIVARDPRTGELAVGVRSRLLAVGSVVPWADAAAGALVTQAWANVTYGPRGLALLREGLAAQQVADRLAEDDEGRESRQLAVVDGDGSVGAHTGAKCPFWAGHLPGSGYVCSGNNLEGPELLEAMAAGYEAAAALPHLADRVLTALAAAADAVDDRRAAALLAVREKGGYGGFSDRLVDLRVDDHPDPLGELGRLLELHRQVWLTPTPPERYHLDRPDRIRLVQAMLRDLGIFDGAVSGELTFNTRGALSAYCENAGLTGLDPSGCWLPGHTMQAMREAVLLGRGQG